MKLRFSLIGTVLVSATLGACTSGSSGGSKDSGFHSWGSDAAPDKLEMIQYQYTYAMQTYSKAMLIQPDGKVQVRVLSGTSESDMKSAEIQLTPEQTKELLNAFRGFKNLKPYYSAFFGPVFSITFGGIRVEGAETEQAPQALLRAKLALDRIGDAAIKASAAATATATAPASQPATKAAQAPAIDSVLASDVDYQFEAQLGGPVVNRHITVSRDGVLEVKEETKNTPPGDTRSPVDAKIQLSTLQLERLAGSLSNMPEGSARFRGINDGPIYQVTYAGRTIVSGGLPDTPASVKAVQQFLEEFAIQAKAGGDE